MSELDAVRVADGRGSLQVLDDRESDGVVADWAVVDQAGGERAGG